MISAVKRHENGFFTEPVLSPTNLLLWYPDHRLACNKHFTKGLFHYIYNLRSTDPTRYTRVIWGYLCLLFF